MIPVQLSVHLQSVLCSNVPCFLGRKLFMDSFVYQLIGVDAAAHAELGQTLSI